jgi:F-type H+-transporting ATPase subunit delta
VEVEIHAAFQLSDSQLADLTQRLEEDRAQGADKVQIDKDLIAGVRIVLGDKVIDGSARAQLGALETALKA